MDEMDHREGKRVMPSKRLPLGAKIGIIAAAAVLALSAGGYIGLCAYVSGGGTVLPNTTAAGVELGGLTEAQAEEKLDKETAELLASQSVSFSYPGGTANVMGTGVEVDANSVARAAYNHGREHGFLGGGAAYLGAFFHGVEIDAPIRFSKSGEQDVDEMLASIEDHLTQKVEQTTYKVEENALVLVKGVSGMSIEGQNIKADLLESFQTWGQKGQPVTVEPQITTPDEPDFDTIYKQVHTVEADAYFDKTTKEVVPSVTGVSFDIATAQALLERTDEGAVCTVPLVKTEPAMTTEKLQENLFKDVLARTSTYASGPASRRENIRLACSFVNDTILLPGEVFSYTDLCGPYTAERYGKAGAYVNGKTVDTTAGGICQLSSTLYWATLVANLETVERAQHRYNTGYLPIVGTDATVYADSPDFKFKNNTEYPIQIECYLDKNNNTRVIIKGTSNGIHGEPFNKLISTEEAKELYEPNAEKVAQGAAPQRDPERTPYNGQTVEVYLRLVDENGNTVETKFLHKDKYHSRNGVYFYNPADAALWGIDTTTGLRTLTPVTPSPSSTPSTEPTEVPAVDPNPGTVVDPSPSTDPAVTTAPVETPPPGIPAE